MTIDGVDCRIEEPAPFDKKWHSHKFKGPGLRCEVCVCIQTGDICWINGPFKCGRWNDVMTFRGNLKQLLAPGEMAECDGGYKADPSCRDKHVIMNPSDHRAKNNARARHENVNSDLKNFECLCQPWRHDRHLHKFAFAAVAVLTQLSHELEGGPNQVVHQKAVAFQ